MSGGQGKREGELRDGRGQEEGEEGEEREGRKIGS